MKPEYETSIFKSGKCNFKKLTKTVVYVEKQNKYTTNPDNSHSY